MRFKAFNARYKMLAPFKRLKRVDDKALDDCSLILQSFQANTTLQLPKDSNVSTSWSLGKRHIFLSEGARQQLEALRAETRHNAAVSIQSTWRGWHFRRRWPTVKRQLELRMGRNANNSSMSVNNAGNLQNHQVSGGSSHVNLNRGNVSIVNAEIISRETYTNVLSCCFTRQLSSV
jgi:myosin heavy subunit